MTTTPPLPDPQQYPNASLTIWVDHDHDGTADANYTYAARSPMPGIAGPRWSWGRLLSGADTGRDGTYASPATDTRHGSDQLVRWRLRGRDGLEIEGSVAQ